MVYLYDISINIKEQQIWNRKKATSYTYDVEKSAERMDDILDANDNDYIDNGNDIPTRDKLTYKKWILC